MKRNLIVLASILTLCGCSKESPEQSVAESGRICFFSNMGGGKSMTETVSVGNFLVNAYYLGTSDIYFSNKVTTTVGAYQVVNGYYWPSSGTLEFSAVYPVDDKYGVYANFSSVRSYIRFNDNLFDGTQDYVTAYATSASTTSPVSMQFRHILSNFAVMNFTGSLSGATFHVTRVKITSLPKSGEYAFSSNSWISFRNEADKTFACPADITGTGTKGVTYDYSVCPGTYTISVDYTVSINGASKSYSKSSAVTFPMGQKTTVNAKLTNDLSPIQFTVGLNDWQSGNANITF